MHNKPILPTPEVVEAYFEEAEQYWALAAKAHEKAEQAAFEDMARARIDVIRCALH
jgi:hypothetical protein